MNTEWLFRVTAADMSGNVIEWSVEPAPGSLSHRATSKITAGVVVADRQAI
jgi:hypothetical protein